MEKNSFAKYRYITDTYLFSEVPDLLPEGMKRRVPNGRAGFRFAPALCLFEEIVLRYPALLEALGHFEKKLVVLVDRWAADLSRL